MSKAKVNYVKATINYSVRQICERIECGAMVFDNIAQRGEVWETTRKSCLIRSILLDFPVDAILARSLEKDGNTVLDVIDAQQRCKSFYQFVKGEYSLTLGDFKETTIELNGEDIVLEGKYFQELPDEFQNKIMNFMMVIDYYTNLPDDVANEMFYFRNNGKAIASDQHMWAMVLSKQEIEEIGRNTTVFQKILSEKARKNYGYRTYLLQAHSLLYYVKERGLEKQKLMPVYTTMEITPADVKLMKRICKLYEKIFDAVDVTYETEGKTYRNKIKSALKKKTHFVSMFPILARALKEKRKEKDIIAWILKFFGHKTNTTISSLYNSAVSTSVLKYYNVEKRMAALEKDYEVYFGLVEAEPEEPEEIPCEENEMPEEIDINELLADAPETVEDAVDSAEESVEPVTTPVAESGETEENTGNEVSETTEDTTENTAELPVEEVITEPEEA